MSTTICSHPHHVLAVDGGGSKTIAWIAKVIPSNQRSQFQIEVVGRGGSGPSNPRSVGFDAAFASLNDAVDQAINEAVAHSAKQASPTRNSIDVACLSLAGVGRAEERKRVKAWADGRSLAIHTLVVNDVEPLRFAAMFEKGHDALLAEPSTGPSIWERNVTLVVGTGSIACGQNGSTSTRTGGWGYLLGDEGSGFAMGLASLQSLCESYDRGQRLTHFQESLLKCLQLHDVTELVGFLYKDVIPRAQVAQLSEIVFNSAATDSIASRIRDEAVEAMSKLVLTTIRKLNLSHESYSLALSGGVLSNHPSLVSQLLSVLQKQQLAPQVWHLIRDPINGPLWMAVQDMRDTLKLV